MTVSESSQWAIFGVFAILMLVGVGAWIALLPKYRQYRRKMSRLNVIDSKFQQLCARRKDLVFHFYWSVDSGDVRDADSHEREVLQIDERIKQLREEFQVAKATL